MGAAYFLMKGGASQDCKKKPRFAIVDRGGLGGF